MLNFKDYLLEKKVPKPTGGLKDACWAGYTAVGMKMKDGRKVPNCVPEETELSEATVKTQKYSWGTMKTIHHGSDFSIPLHPEHHHEIAKLGDEQEHKFKDETGRHWTARRKGEDVHFHSANDGPKTVVKHSALKEEIDENAPVAPVPDKKYIKGTPEHKALKDAQKPRTGHPTNVKEEHLVHVNDGSKYGDKPHPKDAEHVMAGAKKHGGELDGVSDKGAFFKFKSPDDAKAFKKHVDSCPHKTCDADLNEEVMDEARFGRGDAYQRDYASSVSGFGKRPREDDEYHNEPKSSSRDVPHAVHINGKKWKTFGSQSHASNVARKIKGATVHREEVEHIDELSKSTLGSYVKKASYDATIKRTIASDFEHIADKARKTSSKAASKELADKYKAKSWQRKKGVGKAVDRLTKEEVEQIDEKSIQARRNKTYKNLMAASKGARLNKDVGLTPDLTGHKNNQQMNKAIGRAASRGELPEEVQLDETWSDSKYKNPEGGLTKAGVMAYRRENPGSKLQTAVRTDPSKLKPGSKKAKRRLSFCRRMKGMKKKLTSAKTARDPDSRINKSLRAWNC